MEPIKISIINDNDDQLITTYPSSRRMEIIYHIAWEPVETLSYFWDGLGKIKEGLDIWLLSF
jgi:hypothetical protein